MSNYRRMYRKIDKVTSPHTTEGKIYFKDYYEEHGSFEGLQVYVDETMIGYRIFGVICGGILIVINLSIIPELYMSTIAILFSILFLIILTYCMYWNLEEIKYMKMYHQLYPKLKIETESERIIREKQENYKSNKSKRAHKGTWKKKKKKKKRK